MFSLTTEAKIAEARERFETKARAEIEAARNHSGLFVLSYPKSGRTWHRALVGVYLATLLDLPEQLAFETESLCKKANLRSLLYSHNSANFIDWLEPDNDLVASPELWKARPVLLLVRNPKDILVSAWHHAVYRGATDDRPFSEFIRDPRTGIVKILAAFNRWYGNRQLAEIFEVISYELMLKDTELVLRQTLALAGHVSVDEESMRHAVAFCRFAEMQSHERNGFYKASVLKLFGDDPRAMKVRKGGVGGWREFMSPDDVEYVDGMIAKLGDPFAHLYDES